MYYTCRAHHELSLNPLDRKSLQRRLNYTPLLLLLLHMYPGRIHLFSLASQFYYEHMFSVGFALATIPV